MFAVDIILFNWVNENRVMLQSKNRIEPFVLYNRVLVPPMAYWLDRLTLSKRRISNGHFDFNRQSVGHLGSVAWICWSSGHRKTIGFLTSIPLRVKLRQLTVRLLSARTVLRRLVVVSRPANHRNKQGRHNCYGHDDAECGTSIFC